MPAVELASGIFRINFSANSILENIDIYFDCVGLHKMLARD